MKAKQMRNGLFAPLFLAAFTACAIPFETATSGGSVVRVEYENPAWAPAYYSGVRYYYFPDLEVYYDLQNRDFVYLSNGRWFFSRELPPFYSDYDLFHSYVISLNVRVFQPWRHHQFYVSNYPRFYYRSFYRNERDHDRIRGFNENDRHPIYHPDYRRGGERDGDRRDNPGVKRDNTRTYQYNPDRRKGDDVNRDSRDENRNDARPPRDGNGADRNNQTGGDNARDNNNGGARNDQSTRPNNEGGRESRYTRDAQEPNYYGRKIGQPVKVERQMREPKSEGRSSGGRR